MTLFAILYFCALVAAVLYLLRQLSRMATAQEENSRHLLEIARDIKSIAISATERSEQKTKE
ncbi:hypothetical protein Ga0100231_013405 [Opitutaceae bacterium TAV4]|nr:hypothetical protein Ga0100231_013405 [Opitutaceae bacterium TAV4]